MPVVAARGAVYVGRAAGDVVGLRGVAAAAAAAALQLDWLPVRLQLLFNTAVPGHLKRRKSLSFASETTLTCTVLCCRFILHRTQ